MGNAMRHQLGRLHPLSSTGGQVGMGPGKTDNNPNDMGLHPEIRYQLQVTQNKQLKQISGRKRKQDYTCTEMVICSHGSYSGIALES